jgi:hypothetical protein
MEAQQKLQKARIATHPYRPTEGAMPSKDTPLVIESGDKLPAGNKPDDSIRYESKGHERQGRHTSKVQPQHARPSIMSLSKEVSWLHELACFAARVYAI